MIGWRHIFEKKERPVVLHYHLFKCAGTSVEHVLEKEFGEDILHLDREAPFARIFDQDVLAELDRYPKVKAITSHQLRMPLPKEKGLKVIPIVFVRHPLDRIQSVYKFDRGRGPLTPDAQLAVENNFADYLRVQIAANKQVVNFHVKNLTDEWNRKEGKISPLGESAHLKRSLAVLQELPVVGIVERYAESVKAFEELISLSFKGFRFQIAESNVNSQRSILLEDRLAEMRKEIGVDLYEELVAVNAKDFVLYDAANDHLNAVLGLKEDSNG